MSVGVAIFIMINAIETLKEIFDIFLEKTPHDTDTSDIKEHIMKIDGVIGVHHIHIWSMDGQNNYATMHIVTNSEHGKIKDDVRNELKEHGICHVTLELEDVGEECPDKNCCINMVHKSACHHHHHHH